jgi:hypothetical protein
MNRFRRVWQFRQKDIAVPGAGHVKRFRADDNQTVGRKMHQPVVAVSAAKQSPVGISDASAIRRITCPPR